MWGNGGTAGTRTQDQSLKRALLYQLSYRPNEARMIAELRRQFTAKYQRYRVGSGMRAAANPAARRRQESHLPQAAPSSAAW
jgi:hypothetical protein